MISIPMLIHKTEPRLNLNTRINTRTTVISPSGFDMTEDFKKSIYELLEQSKLEKELNKVKENQVLPK